LEADSVIITVKVLGLRAATRSAVAGAVWRVVDYLHGGTPGEGARSTAHAGGPPTGNSGLVGYYTGGVARGSAAALVGMRAGGAVSPVQLARLLAGRHARSGTPLVPAAGSAGRAGHDGRPGAGLAGVGEWLPLAEAARIAGVSARYLRRLAARTSRKEEAGTVYAAARPADDGPTETGAGRDRLTARKDSAGRWRVHREELARFLDEREPPTVVLGFDVTASAPKSVSLLWAFGDADLRRDITAAMNAAVDVAIGYLERHAGVGMVDGHNRPGVGVAGVSFLHDISRAEEPHLHIHTVLANAVPIPLADEDGEPLRDEYGRPRIVWRTVDSELLYTHLKTAGYMAAAVLRHDLSVRRGLRWGPVRNGVAELAGLPADLLAVFSSRRAQIDAELVGLVAGGATDGAALREAVQRATRAPKRAHADAEIRAAQQARLQTAGWTAADVHAAGGRTGYRPVAIGPADVDELAELLTGPDGLTARSATFTAREVVQAIAAWGGDRLDAAGIDRLTARILADPRLATVDKDTPRRRRDPEPVYTTLNHLEAEDSLLGLCRAVRTAHSGLTHRLLDPDRLDAAITRHLQPDGLSGADRAESRANVGAQDSAGAPGGTALSAEQVEAVRTLLTSTDLVRLLVGPAGSGKTEAMRLAVAVLHDAGLHVVGGAHGGRQTEDLTTRLGINGRVVAGWLTLLDHTNPAGIWPPGTVLILDEATHINSRDAERLLRYATATGTVVIALGDPAQLSAIGPGGWFTHLATTLPDVPTLTTVHRHTGPGMDGLRAALTGLRAGAPAHVRRALARLADDGRLRRFTDRPSLLATVVDDWHHERTTLSSANQAADDTSGTSGGAKRAPNGAAGAPSDANGATGDANGATGGANGAARPARGKAAGVGLAGLPRMMAADHGTVDWLNRAAQLRRIHAGDLHPDRFLDVCGRRFHVGDEVITLTQAGHTLIPTGRPPSAYIRTGTIGTVTALHHDPDQPDRQALTVDFPGKGRVTVGWDYLTHTFPDGRDGGLAHAYAITAHKAQGATMTTARSVVTDRTSRAGLYVMLSRARTHLAAYLIAADTLTARPDDEDWLPVLPAPGDTLDRLAGHLAASRPDRLTQALDPDAAAVAALRRRHTLAELTALRRQAHRALADAHPHAAPRAETRRSAHDSAAVGANRGATGALLSRNGVDERTNYGAAFGANGTVLGGNGADESAHDGAVLGANGANGGASGAPNGDGGVADPVVLARAERAGEAAVAAAALADPPAALLARIGPRPLGGPARRAWDNAVTSLAVYQARHAPHLDPGNPGPSPADNHDDDLRHHWEERHDLAAALACAWASALHPTGRPDARGPAADRAAAAIHALLDTGRTPAEISQILETIDRGTIRDGLAILDHRLTRLCDIVGISPAAYTDPPPAGARHDWQRTIRLLDHAEIHHLASRPTPDLARELRTLHPAAGAPQTPDEPEPAQPRQARLLAAALDLQADTAVVHAAADPPAYLTGLLGPRPDQAKRWDQAATSIERYRHHTLGLAHGVPASPETAPAAEQALGPAPGDADRRARWHAFAKPDLGPPQPPQPASPALDLDL
jgi:conjugative relaxase-like TrwC/TraI family protein